MSTNTTIGSLTIGFRIIDIVAQSDAPLKFTDIQDLMDISKSNLYKYLNTLTQLGLLYRDQKRGSYSLGYKFLQYGTIATQNTDFVGRLTPYFKEISKLTNMTTLLVTWVNDSPVITHIWNTNYGLNIGAQLGTKMPVNSATGKIFAAYANSFEMSNWIEEEQKANSQFDIIKFQHELKEIRKNKFVHTYEPLVSYVSSISFPILNYNQELICAFAVVGFNDDVPTELDHPMIQEILSLSAEMSRIFGYEESRDIQ